jgi:hypothetical protein
MIIPAIVLGSILRKPQQKPCEISMFEGDFPTENPEELIFSRCGCHLAGQLEVTGELPVWTKSKA